MKKFFSKRNIYIGLFSILYLIVAFSSFFHAISFFGLANNVWMSIILAFAFEIGQAAVLFSLLTSKKDRSRIMPWVLMFMFTLVQVIGNVFSSYKYIMNNSIENLRFFKEPIFIWTDLPDNQATVIITYVVGAILPVASLLLTSMITNYLNDIDESKELDNKPDNSELEKENQELKEENQKLKEDLEKRIENLRTTENTTDEEIKKKNEIIENLKKELEENKSLEDNKELQDKINNLTEEVKEKTALAMDYRNQIKSYEDKIKELEEQINNSKKDEEVKKSHFVNL